MHGRLWSVTLPCIESMSRLFMRLRRGLSFPEEPDVFVRALLPWDVQRIVAAVALQVRVPSCP